MDDDVREIIEALGALAELCGEFYRQLLRCGFDRKAALTLTRDYLVTTLGKDDCDS